MRELEELEEVFREAIERGEAVDVDLTLIEEVFGDEEVSEEEWRRVFCHEVPMLLLGVLARFGSAVVFHRKDDIVAPEYIAIVNGNCLGIDVKYDHHSDSIVLLAVYAISCNYAKSILSYYHPC